MIVGIPHYNNEDGLDRVLTSLINSTNSITKIIIINSGKPLTLNMQSIDVEVIQTPKRGPLDAYNRLFKIAKERKEDLFLTQTDVLFPKCHNRDWLAEMKTGANISDCGMITCLGGGGQSGPEFINGYKWVGAWCTYIPYRTIKKIGGYDMNFPLGWGVDIDYTYAVRQAGLKVYCINYWVDHRPNYEKGHIHEKVSDIEEKKKEAFLYMRKKWKIGEFKR